MVGSVMAAVVLFVAPLPLVGTAGASPQSSTEAQIQALDAQIQSSATRIGELTATFDQARDKASTLAAMVTGDGVRLGLLHQQVDASLDVLRQEAVISYTGAAAGADAATAASVETSEVSNEYLSIAVGSVAESLDQLNLQQRQVASAQASIRQEQASEQREVSAAGAARQLALQRAGQEQALLDQDQQQLARLQAASAAAAAAQARAAAAVATTVAPGTQGQPVGNGVVDAVRSALSSTPPVSSNVPATTTPPTTGLRRTPTTAPPSTISPTTIPPTTVSPTTSSPPTTTAPTTTPPTTDSGGVWAQLRECESGDNYQANTGNGFYGAYQFSASTWTDMGYPGRPDLEPPAMQDQAAMRLEAQSGWSQWPTCAALLGLH